MLATHSSQNNIHTVIAFHLFNLSDCEIIKLFETTCYLCDLIFYVFLLQGYVFVM